jgi:hypothetical protein
VEFRSELECLGRSIVVLEGGLVLWTLSTAPTGFHWATASTMLFRS